MRAGVLPCIGGVFSEDGQAVFGGFGTTFLLNL